MKKMGVWGIAITFMFCIAIIGVGVFCISPITANIIGEVSILPKIEVSTEIESYPTLEFYLIDSKTNSVAVQQNPSNMPSGHLVIPPLIICGGVEYTVTTIACNTGGTKLVPTTTLAEEEISSQETILEDSLYGAFAECTEITGLIIPDSVTRMDEMSFYGCTSLQNVVIGNGVTIIENNTFAECQELYNLTIGSSVETIGFCAFDYCQALKEIILPDSVTTLYEFAFGSCNEIEKLHVGKGVKNLILEDPITLGFVSVEPSQFFDVIWGFAADLTHSNLQEITVNKDNAIFNDANGSNVIIETATNLLIFGCNKSNIPYGVESIGYGAFKGCEELISVTLPTSVTDIGYDAFSYCTNLKTINLPIGLKNIDGSAFSNCSELTDVILPDGLEYIGTRAFEYCSNITSIILPESLIGLGEKVFADTGVVYNTYDNANYLGSASNSYFALIGYTSIVITSCTINENCKIMAGHAFGGSKIQTITIPDGISVIPSYAFDRCKSLNTVVSGAVITIEVRAFNNCTSLTTITIGAGIKSIGAYAFDGCSALTDFYCNATTPPELGINVFNGCGTFTLHVPSESLTAYKNSTWGDYFV